MRSRTPPHLKPPWGPWNLDRNIESRMGLFMLWLPSNSWLIFFPYMYVFYILVDFVSSVLALTHSALTFPPWHPPHKYHLLYFIYYIYKYILFYIFILLHCAVSYKLSPTYLFLCLAPCAALLLWTAFSHSETTDPSWCPVSLSPLLCSLPLHFGIAVLMSIVISTIAKIVLTQNNKTQHNPTILKNENVWPPNFF